MSKRRVIIGAVLAVGAGLAFWKWGRETPVHYHHCPYCNLSFDTRTELVTHMTTYHPPDPESDIRIDSFTVSATTTTAWVRATTLVTNYGQEPGYIVVVYSSPDIDYETATVAVVKPGQTIPLGLNLDGNRFPGPGTYDLFANEFKFTFTLEPTVFYCPHCELGFDSQEALALHIEQVHEQLGLIGDLNDDGKINEDDLEILKLYMWGYEVGTISPLPEAEFLRRADVNGDGIIDAGDMTALKILMAG